MLLESQSHGTPDQDTLDRYEQDCVAFYSRCAERDLQTELEDVLQHLVGLRRELHRALTERRVRAAEEALPQLLYVEAQASALRRVRQDLGLPDAVVVPGPADRRERRRTARS